MVVGQGTWCWVSIGGIFSVLVKGSWKQFGSLFIILIHRTFSIKMKPGVWYWALSGILSVSTVLGNGLVIYLIFSRKRLHKTVNWLLFSLALADLCVGLVYFPSEACISATLCSKCITTALRWLFLNLSMTNLCSLTIDRYIAVVTPLKYSVFKTKRRHWILISAAWILPFVVHFVPFTWMKCSGMKNGVRNFLTVLLFVFKLPPFLLLFIACSKTLHIARGQKKRASVQLTQLSFNGFCRQSDSTIRSQAQASTFAKALGIIVAIFFICYAIDIARLICFTFQCLKYIPRHASIVQRLLFVFNSASNPIVYAFLKQDIRRELKSVIKCFASWKFVATRGTLKHVFALGLYSSRKSVTKKSWSLYFHFAC